MALVLRQRVEALDSKCTRKDIIALLKNLPAEDWYEAETLITNRLMHLVGQYDDLVLFWNRYVAKKGSYRAVGIAA